MILQTVLSLVPAAIAIAITPLPVIAVVLGTPRARSNGAMFTAGWVLALAAVSVLVVLILDGLGDADGGSSLVIGVVQIAIGVLLLALAARQWTQRTRRGEKPATPGWMASIDELTPGRSFAFGAALAGANPKNIALTVAADSSIAAAGLDTAGTALAVAAYVLLGSVTVLGALLFYLSNPDRAREPLARVKEFMQRYIAVIITVIFLVLGASVISGGIASVTG